MGKGTGQGKAGAAECCAACGAVGICCFIVLLVLALIALGIAKIVMGAIYIHDCNINYLIPIWLIVSGCAPILFGGFGRQSEGDDSITGATICGIIGFLFNLSWTIAGSVWIYKAWGTIHSDGYVHCTDKILVNCTKGTCNDTLLTFAFAMVTMDWIFTALWVSVLGCTLARACKTR